MSGSHSTPSRGQHKFFNKPLSSIKEWRARHWHRPGQSNYHRRPSVALADYEISDTRMSAMSSLLLLFALFEGMCGLVLPICHAFSKTSVSKQRRYYYENFLIMQYCLSLFALFYLQALIFYYDRKDNQRRKRAQKLRAPLAEEDDLEQEEEEDEDGRNSDALDSPPISRKLGHYHHGELREEPLSIENAAQHHLVDTNVHVEGGPIADSHRPSAQYSPSSLPRMPVHDGHHHVKFSDVEAPQHVHQLSQGDYNGTAVIAYRKGGDIGDEQLTATHGTAESKKNSGQRRSLTMAPLSYLFGDDDKHNAWSISRNSEGVSLYLRLGAVGFGFGVMIFDGFKLAEPWEVAGRHMSSCHGAFWIPIHIIHFICVFWQTYFLFKHHQIVFNVQKFAIRFLLCHLAIFNLCQWLKTIVDEIDSETEEEAEASSMHRINGNTTTAAVGNATLEHAAVAGMGTCHSTAKRLAPYLFPCAIEYSLIGLAMFYKMFQKVGHVHEESERLERLRQAKSIGRDFTECHRSHKGLFIGLLIFMATLVAMCLFFIFIAEHDKHQLAILVYQGTELSLLVVGIFICLACLLRLRVLKFSELSEEGAFDDNLLLVGLLGMLFYDLFILIPTLETPESEADRRLAKLFAAKAILEIAQSMIQVYFILEASRRCAASLADVRKKPGRTLVTLLLILNLAMWVVNTFEVKRADSHGLQKNYYSDIAWKIITHIALPLIVFFRFHSTVCLADVWANAYIYHSNNENSPKPLTSPVD